MLTINGRMCTGSAVEIFVCSEVVDCCGTMPLAQESMDDGRGSAQKLEGVFTFLCV